MENLPEGSGCSSDSSCATGWCKDGSVCAKPSPTDGIENGSETDVDCGGANAPKCALGKKCETDADCASRGCSYKKVCIARPSCAGHFGGDTCGPGETDGANQHESCCTAIDVPAPSGTVAMDKYQITAGRFRRFLESIDGNVRKFVSENPPPEWDEGWNTFVPNGWGIDPALENADWLTQARSSVWHQIGATELTDRVGKNGQPFEYGCYLKGYGTHTYRFPDDVQASVMMDIPHKYPQEVLDTKALNCVTSLMLRAFCHWDQPGARLPTYLEYRYAYDKGDRRRYPWGDGPAPVGYRTLEHEVGYDANGKPIEYLPNGGEGRGRSLNHAAWGQSYTWPPNPQYPDMSAHIAAPGRYPAGNGPFGHADLGGNVFDLTQSMTGKAGMHPDDREVQWGRNGTYGGHDLPFGEYDKPWQAVTMRKYGFAGGRCVLPK